jgi:potassium inwardly-rectifying channel subfamily J
MIKILITFYEIFSSRRSKFSPQNTDRLVSKTGHVNIQRENVGRVQKRFIADLFTALVDAPWRYMFCAFICNYLLSWTFFAGCWYLMAVLHGDIDYYKEWLDADDKESFERANEHTPCVRNLYNFASAFLYSIETQNAVGEFRAMMSII